MQTKPIEVAVAESNSLMMSALTTSISKDGRFSLVATSSSAEGFLQAVLRVPVAVGVVDWFLPELGTERLIQLLRDQASAPRIVVYAQGNTAELSRRAMAAGAAGFCARDVTPAQLLDTVADVAAGKMVFPYLDVRDLANDPFFSLTRTERDLLALVATGGSNREIAEQQGVSINTVKFHLRNIYEKLSIRNRAQAVAFFYSNKANLDAGD